MWKATEPKVRKKAGMVILMDYKSWDAYDQYLSSKTVKYSDNRDEMIIVSTANVSFLW